MKKFLTSILVAVLFCIMGAKSSFGQLVSGTAYQLTTISLADSYIVVPPGACAINQSGGTLSGVNGLQTIGASFTPVVALATTTTTDSPTITCVATLPTRTLATKGATINDVTFIYGNSVGATATCNAPTVSTITLPTPGTSETASTVAPVAVAGTLTVTPAVASCNTAAVTAGAFYTEKVALGTPFAVNPDFTTLYFQQGFVGPSAASYTIYTGGLIVHFTNNPF